MIGDEEWWRLSIETSDERGCRGETAEEGTHEKLGGG